MSFLKKLFGGGSLDELKSEADALFDARRYGEAKLVYERALGKAKGAPEEIRATLADRLDACLDGIAESRLAEAERHIEAGAFDLARDELEGAIEVVQSPEVRGRVQKAIDLLERDDAIEHAKEESLSDEERLALIAGQWVDGQAEEYEALGDPLYDALLALHDERYEEARQALEALLEHAEDPCFLYLEVGRARLLSDDSEGGRDALQSFLDGLAPGEGGEARLAAHLELARIADGAGDFDGAMAQYEAAIDGLPDDYRPFLALGIYLRSKEIHDQAVEMLEIAHGRMDDLRPDWRVMQELGLALADAGREAEAIEQLEAVIAFMTSQRHLDFPPATAVRLAELHEKADKPERAADLYRSLASGSHRAGHATYHREAGRLLAQLGLTDEATRMLKRAIALSEDDEEAAAAAQAELDAIS